MIKCLLQQYADKFLEGLRKGEIDPAKLTEMKSSERREFFSKYVGKENAKFVNTEFESKLLLKNQKAGLITWAKNISGLKESVRADIITKIEKLDKALDTTSENTLLSDIIEKRLGIKVNIEEANFINDITQKMRNAYATRFDKPRSDYFRYKQQLIKYIREKSPEAVTNNSFDKAGLIVSNIVSIQRALKASFDLSAPFRQGITYFGRKQWNNAFIRMFDYANSKTAIDELEVDMMSNKYADEVMKYKRQLGLTLLGENINQREEAFAAKVTEKIPGIAMSARAYEGFLNDLRFNRFVDTIDKLENAGINITKDEEAMKNLAKVIATSTGRGSLGKLEGSGAISALAAVLFSPRLMASRIQVLLNPITKSGPARGESAKALATVIGLSTLLIGLAKMLGSDIEDDPTSSDFGKIKINNTRFDVTGGFGSYINFISRQLKGSTKSSETDIVTKLNTGKFGAKNRLELFYNLIENKTSPIASIVRDYLKGETFDGKKLGSESSLKENAQYLADALFTPLLAKDAIEAYKQGADDNDIAIGISGAVSSFFGIGANTYTFEENWLSKDNKNLNAFKDKIGEDKFIEANDKFNKTMKNWLDGVIKEGSYKNLSDDDKRSLVTKKKNEVTSAIYKEYGFKPKRESSTDKKKEDIVNKLLKV